MKIRDKHNVYFVGIGGIGMSALARWFLHQGKKVSGYDKTKTPLTHKLEKEGAEIHYQEDIHAIDPEILDNKASSLVIWTPAIPQDHKELVYFRQNNFDLYKRSELLGLISNDLYSVAVAGTHGKTTTSSMIAHILKTAEKSSIAFMGGILQGYESNLIMHGKTNDDTVAVLEADEYDRSFLRLSPDIAVVTSADPDHLDIYGEHEEMRKSFKDFINRVKVGGHLFVNESLQGWLNKEGDISFHTYGFKESTNEASNIRIKEAQFLFDFVSKDQNITDLKLNIPGYHNVENATAAVAVCLQLGIDVQSIQEGLSTFKGIKRRFEYHVKSNDLIYIDDYAHHPVEINALLKSVRSMYPEMSITVLFQPHLFTRTRDFATEFAHSLDQADRVFIMDIYPARELPIEGVSAEIILNQMKLQDKSLIREDEILEVLGSIEKGVVLTVGAGNIDRFVLPIKKVLQP